MKLIEVVLNNRFGESEAYRRIAERLIRFEAEHQACLCDMAADWKDRGTCTFSFHYKNIPVSGTLLVTEDELRLQLMMPVLAIWLKSGIDRDIRVEAEAMLNPNGDPSALLPALE